MISKNDPMASPWGSAKSFATGDVSGTKNGTNKTFTIPAIPGSGALFLFLNGQYLTETVDYTIAGTTITMVNAPFDTDILTYKY